MSKDTAEQSAEEVSPFLRVTEADDRESLVQNARRRATSIRLSMPPDNFDGPPSSVGRTTSNNPSFSSAAHALGHSGPASPNASMAESPQKPEPTETVASSPNEAPEKDKPDPTPASSVEEAKRLKQEREATDRARREKEDRKWRSRRKHVFVFTSASRPAFSRWGDESDFSELFGILNVLMATSESQGLGKLRYVSMGTHTAHFFVSGELRYVMVTATGESVRSCADQLRLIHMQFLSQLPNVDQILDRQPGYDIRSRLDLTMVNKLIRRLNADAKYCFRAVECVPMLESVRETADRILYDGFAGWETSLGGGHFASLLLCRERIASIVMRQDEGEKGSPTPASGFHTDDMLLLINFALCMQSAPGEVWAPLCLPLWNESGMVWGYVRSLPDGVIFVQLATVSEFFPQLRQTSETVIKRLEQANVLSKMIEAVSAPLQIPLPLAQTGLVYMAHVGRSGQLIQSALPPHVCTHQHKKAFLRQLVRLRDTALGCCKGKTPFLIHGTAEELVVVEVIRGAELYAVFLPTTPRGAAQDALRDIAELIRQKEPKHCIRKATMWPAA